jgi:oleandomycin transport system permease protein
LSVLTGTGLNEDVSKGIIDRFRSLPIARSAVLGGRILADTVRLVATVLVIMVVGVLLGFRFGGGPLAALAGFLLIIAFGMALSGVAAFIGLSVPQPRDGPVGRVHLDVPADVRQLGVRGRLDHAGLAANP